MFPGRLSAGPAGWWESEVPQDKTLAAAPSGGERPIRHRPGVSAQPGACASPHRHRAPPWDAIAVGFSEELAEASGVSPSRAPPTGPGMPGRAIDARAVQIELEADFAHRRRHHVETPLRDSESWSRRSGLSPCPQPAAPLVLPSGSPRGRRSTRLRGAPGSRRPSRATLVLRGGPPVQRGAQVLAQRVSGESQLASAFERHAPLGRSPELTWTVLP